MAGESYSDTYELEADAKVVCSNHAVCMPQQVDDKPDRVSIQLDHIPLETSAMAIITD